MTAADICQVIIGMMISLALIITARRQEKAEAVRRARIGAAQVRPGAPDPASQMLNRLLRQEDDQ